MEPRIKCNNNLKPVKKWKIMSGTPWILKTFQIDQTGSTGAHLFIEARQPGIFAFILNLVGLDPTAQLKVTKGAVSFRSTSLSGMTETSTALTQIGSFQGGYSNFLLENYFFVPLHKR